jgi:hypothetical protein
VCSIILEKKAKYFILDNIQKATSYNTNKLLNKIRNYQYQTTMPLNLRNFSSFYRIPLELIYKKRNWARLCVLAEQIDDYPLTNEDEVFRAISKKWLSCNSISYFEFILSLSRRNFDINLSTLNEVEKTMCLMLHYDVWQTEGGFNSIEDSIRAIGRNPKLSEEITELLELLTDKIDFIEKEANLSYSQPLKLHSRYTREQVLAAFGLSTFEKKSSNREGVAENKVLKTEILFVDLIKSESDAISVTLFHWQTQNNTRPDKGKGLSYIHHEKSGKTILLFVRERNDNEYGNTMSFVFIGEAKYLEHYGSKPMSITWELKEPMPHYLWKETAKMAIG